MRAEPFLSRRRNLLASQCVAVAAVHRLKRHYVLAAQRCNGSVQRGLDIFALADFAGDGAGHVLVWGSAHELQGVADALQLMGRAPDEHVTGAIAREICERENIKAALNGTIAALGSQYVMSLEAVNCRNGDTLARE